MFTEPFRRIIEKQVGDQFVRVRMKELKAGDHFRMFESFGEPVNNGALLLAVSDGYEDESGVGRIEIETV